MTEKKPTDSEETENLPNPDDLTLQWGSPTPEEVAKQKREWHRQCAMTQAVNVYAHAIPLGESGQRVGETLVEIATVIERFLSGNSD